MSNVKTIFYIIHKVLCSDKKGNTHSEPVSSNIWLDLVSDLYAKHKNLALVVLYDNLPVSKSEQGNK